MKNMKFSFQAQKLTASLLHLLFLIIMFIGIELMYLNDNFGIGITRFQNIAFEDTDEFDDIFNKDLNDIFYYIEYNHVFSTKNSIDVSKTMLRMTFGPNDTKNYSLGELISYLQSLGYLLNDDFKCESSSNPDVSEKSPIGYVVWSASEPNQFYGDMKTGLKRCTLEEISLEIMASLNRYYSTYSRLILNPSNLHFKIEYLDKSQKTPTSTLYTNDSLLTPETVKQYKKYAYLPGNSVFYDTNLKSIALNTISSIAANNPYEGNSYYLLASVDTAYPEPDPYYEGYRSYIQMQHSYIIGFVFMLIGGLFAVATLIYLFFVSGHHTRNDKLITLHRFDKLSTETGIAAIGVLSLFSLALCRLSLVRISHLILPQEAWELSERTLCEAVLYLCSLLLAFSLLRRYKAGVLWSNSLLFKCKKKCAVFFTKQEFSVRLTIGFLTYFITNSLLLSMVWILLRKMYLSPFLIRILIYVVLLIWLAFNIWIFYLIFCRSVEHDLIYKAIERLAAGETNYKVDLNLFRGKEQELAINLNNISMGLETALQEKVKSERLKADLITNVSHDIKTPLTSIINYVDLIKREHIENENLNRYLDVLEQKAHRLKTLTEDLVEASKASSGNLKLEISKIDFIELIYQTNGEFEEKFSKRNLKLITSAPEETLIVEADGRCLWRVLENLYNNTFKYAMEGSRVYIDITKEEERVGEDDTLLPPQAVFTIKNISSNPLNIRADELTERFVRGDVSRATEGSGLGLSIAKSLTELQSGSFEIYIDGDLFKVQIGFPIRELVKPTSSSDITTS